MRLIHWFFRNFFSDSSRKSFRKRFLQGLSLDYFQNSSLLYEFNHSSFHYWLKNTTGIIPAILQITHKFSQVFHSRMFFQEKPSKNLQDINQRFNYLLFINYHGNLFIKSSKTFPKVQEFFQRFLQQFLGFT